MKISCGHEYHYDCIYDAFLYNRKRNTTVLECPYCRMKVDPIKEMSGFNFDASIHLGIAASTNPNWSKIHFGTSHCIYNVGELYCNKHFIYGCGKNYQYCSMHKNVKHMGEEYCEYLKGYQNYCNYKCMISKSYCYKHAKYANALLCCHIFEKGAKKGEMCNKRTVDNKLKCKLHDKPSNIVKKQCCEILKCGKNKGKECGKTGFNGSNYCKNHFTVVNDLITISL